MKSLLLIRHAKSDWGNPFLRDFDRSLNERGKKDAPRMAEKLLERKIKIDAFVSSPAKRAAKTATIIAEAFGKKKEKIIFIDKLYMASPETFLEVIKGLDDNIDTAALFSHNEGITEFANTLTQVRVDNIPTCGIFAVKAEISSWSAFYEGEKRFWFFDYPKL